MGLNRTEFAEFLGLPYRTYQDIDSGKVKRPQKDTREQIDKALGARAEGETEEEWDGQLTAFLDILGAYLWALPASTRSAIIHEMIRDLAIRSQA